MNRQIVIRLKAVVLALSLIIGTMYIPVSIPMKEKKKSQGISVGEEKRARDDARQ